MGADIKNGGFTQLPHSVLEALMSARLNASEYAIALCVIRHTTGFNRKSHTLSASFISKSTNLGIDTVKRAIPKMVQKKIMMEYVKGTGTRGREIGLNFNVSEWGASSVSQYTTKKSSSVSQYTTRKTENTPLSSVSQYTTKGASGVSQYTQINKIYINKYINKKELSLSDIKEIETEENLRGVIDGILDEHFCFSGKSKGYIDYFLVFKEYKALIMAFKIVGFIPPTETEFHTQRAELLEAIKNGTYEYDED